MTSASTSQSSKDLIALQADVHILCHWVESNDLRLNVQKTKSMLITRKRHPPALELFANNTPIEQVKTVKYLGVRISQDLSWTHHILDVCLKARRRLGFLYRSFTASTGVLSRLYKTLVLPILEYCGSVWDPHQTTYISKLERVQCFAAKLATHS